MDSLTAEELRAIMVVCAEKAESASHMVLNVEEEELGFWQGRYKFWSTLQNKIAKAVERSVKLKIRRENQQREKEHS